MTDSPEFTILNRVASIPLVSSSLEAVDSALSSNPVTRSPYHAAGGTADTTRPQSGSNAALNRVASIPLVSSSLDQIHSALSSNVSTRADTADATQSQPQSRVSESTILNRVASIPLVSSSLDQADSILSSDPVTRSPYHAATADVTQSQPQSQVSESTILNRVTSTPLVSSSLDQVDSALSSDTFTRSPYHAAQAVAQTTNNVSQPLQAGLTPTIKSADGYANKALDAVEQRYSSLKSEGVASYTQERDSVLSSANERFNESVKAPAVGVANDMKSEYNNVRGGSGFSI